MKWWKFAVLGFAVAACSNDVAQPRENSLISTAPSFIKFSSSGYTFAEKSGSFWAKKGSTRSVSLRYTDTNAEFLNFTVPSGSLFKRPDGTAIEDGDSVLINVVVDDAGRMLFHFEPSGLRFKTSDPALLTINADRADPLDVLLAPLASIWKRESALLPWLQLPTLHVGTTVQSDIKGFTDFGMATN
ncbi:MAG TPA: hypothetical protein VM100_07710 [Longimicrobiales bacterium]|nr:hypothetical protein [Longimicrobiales bacterium]